MTQLWTAQFRYPGPYRMDITHATTDRLGKLFAPTKQMVNAYKYSIAPEPVAREVYIEQYHALMLERIVSMHYLWREIKQLPYIVLVCYCNAKAFCHRHIATDYLVDRGATYIGELTDFSEWQKPKPINNFRGDYSWASNFYPSPFTYQSIKYPTNEHFFVGWKGDISFRKQIAALPTPDQAKRLGRKVKLCWNWNTIKSEIMRTGLFEKFTQNPQLAAKLRATKGIELIEGNNWCDNYWGDCNCHKCIETPGQNMLGKQLMALRNII